VTPAEVLAEHAALGACLLGREHADAVLELLTEADFTDPRAAPVLVAVRALREQGAHPEPLTVLGELQRQDRMPAAAKAHAARYLYDLAVAARTPAEAAWYAADVIEASLRRRTEQAGARLDRAAYGSLERLLAVTSEETAALAWSAARLERARAPYRRLELRLVAAEPA